MRHPRLDRFNLHLCAARSTARKRLLPARLCHRRCGTTRARLSSCGRRGRRRRAPRMRTRTPRRRRSWQWRPWASRSTAWSGCAWNDRGAARLP